MIALPDADTLTVEGRPIGPAHFTAYELIRDAAHAQPHPADVYSLGKTLWVLATDQRFPPHGHQPIGMRGFEIGDFRPHPRATALDQEIDLMTRVHPEDRPTKEQVARDLAAWSALAREPAAIDVSEARRRLREKLAPTIAQQDMQEQQKELALATVRRLQALTKPLNDALKSLSARAQIDSSTDKLTINVLKSHGRYGGPQVEFRWQRCTVVSPLDRLAATTLRMGRSVELLHDGTLVLHLMVNVGPDGVMGSDFDWHRPSTSAPVGSVEAEQMLDEGVRDLTAALQKAIDVFVERLPDAGGS